MIFKPPLNLIVVFSIRSIFINLFIKFKNKVRSITDFKNSLENFLVRTWVFYSQCAIQWTIYLCESKVVFIKKKCFLNFIFCYSSVVSSPFSYLARVFFHAEILFGTFYPKCVSFLSVITCTHIHDIFASFRWCFFDIQIPRVWWKHQNCNTFVGGF